MGIRRTKTVAEETRSDRGMHFCPRCESDLVQPVQWFELSGCVWQVDLRCPECEWWERGNYSQDDVDRFDEELDRGGSLLVEDMRALTRSNMQDEADSFASALATGCILPEDF
jgi:hypothetical protein